MYVACKAKTTYTRATIYLRGEYVRNLIVTEVLAADLGELNSQDHHGLAQMLPNNSLQYPRDLGMPEVTCKDRLLSAIITSHSEFSLVYTRKHLR